VEDRSTLDLPGLLQPGDVLVVNDAATLPASLRGDAEGHGRIELRLMGESAGAWRAVLFAGGSWRVPTERRPAPPRLAVGTRLTFGDLSARVEAVLPPSPRLLLVRFDQTGAEFWSALYRTGRPVQYAYLGGPLELWHVQNRYAARPWAVEAPSAGFVLSGQLLTALLRRGVHLCALTHATGLSATGDAALDVALPLVEHFEISEECALCVSHARANGGRIVAVGTSVVRALESRAIERSARLIGPERLGQTALIRPGPGTTGLKLGPDFVPQIVDGLLSGIHDPSASHYALLQAFAPRAWLDEANRRAEQWGYLEHEFGDSCLIL
jgi:S-adenosylmethionine:tRNA ribosyltransferase-isomerase